jgi:hydrogenase small subunit
MEQALAAVTACTPNFPKVPLARVVWIAGAACSGCPTSLLNYIADKNDPDTVLNVIANNSLGLWSDIEALYPVSNTGANFGVDGLPLTPDDVGDHNIDIAEVVLEIISIEYAQVVMQASGDIPNTHLINMRDSLSAADNYVLLVEGTIQIGSQGRFCKIMDLPTVLPGGIWDNAPGGSYVIRYDNDGDTINDRTELTMAGATLWLASSPRCQAVLALGTCAAWGGIPAAAGHVTTGKSAWEWINGGPAFGGNSLGMTLVNIPGCPPNPDWVIHTIGAYALGLLNLDMSTDSKGRPKLTSTAIFHDKNYVFCQDCPRRDKGYANTLAKGRKRYAKPKGLCLADMGCMGWIVSDDCVRADCPTRMWNPIEKYPAPLGNLKLKKNNWCVGNNYPCQGCTDPGFPDLNSPFFVKK